MKFFKSSQHGAGQRRLHHRVDPVVKGEEYDITRVITEVFPVEVQELFRSTRTRSPAARITALTNVHDDAAVASRRRPGASLRGTRSI